MQLVLMNMSARFKNKEPTFGCRKHLSHRKKKIKSLFKNCSINVPRTKDSELEKTKQLLFFEHFIFSGIINKIFMKLFKHTEHRDGVLSCFYPLIVYQGQFCFASLSVVASCFVVVVVAEFGGKWKERVNSIPSTV